MKSWHLFEWNGGASYGGMNEYAGTFPTYEAALSAARPEMEYGQIAVLDDDGPFLRLVAEKIPWDALPGEWEIR